MKLLTIHLLSALPLLCYAGYGCKHIKDVVYLTINSTVTPQEYVEHLKPYIKHEDAPEALMDLKACFNKHDEETLKLVGVLMETIANTKWCALHEDQETTGDSPAEN